MAAGLVNTLRQVGTATGVAVLGALYAARVTTATLHAMAGLPAPPGAVHRLAAAVASGAGTRVAAVVPPAARAAVTHAARAGTASGLNDVLLGPHPTVMVGAVAARCERRRSRRPCHPRAISSGHERYPADSHGHFEDAGGLTLLPDLEWGSRPKLHGMQGVRVQSPYHQCHSNVSEAMLGASSRTGCVNEELSLEHLYLGVGGIVLYRYSESMAAYRELIWTHDSPLYKGKHLLRGVSQEGFHGEAYGLKQLAVQDKCHHCRREAPRGLLHTSYPIMFFVNI